MPKVHYVKKARKNNRVAKKGEPYYWWKFRYGPKMYSKEYPDRSQLTQSEFLSGMYALEDRWSSFDLGSSSFEEAADELEEMAEEVRELGSECESRRDSMPESLQCSETGELLGMRYEQCEEIANSLEDAANEIRDFISSGDEDASEKELMESVRDAWENVCWTYE